MADYKDIIKGTINSITEKARDIAESGVVRDMYEKGTGKAKALGAITKLTLELNGEAEELKKVYTEIGKLYYEELGGQPAGFFVPLFEKVSEISAHMEILSKQLEDMKAEFQAEDGEMNDADFEAIVKQQEEEAKGFTDEEK